MCCTSATERVQYGIVVLSLFNVHRDRYCFILSENVIKTDHRFKFDYHFQTFFLWRQALNRFRREFPNAA